MLIFNQNASSLNVMSIKHTAMTLTFPGQK